MQLPGRSPGLLIQKEPSVQSGSQQFHPVPGGWLQVFPCFRGPEEGVCEGYLAEGALVSQPEGVQLLFSF